MVSGGINALPGSSPGRPAPVGETVKTWIEHGIYAVPKIYVLEIALLEVVRGKGARERMQAMDVVDPPGEGFEYVLARVRCGYFRKHRGSIQDVSFKLREGQFAAASANGMIQYELPPAPAQLEPQLTGRILDPGDRHEGWILLQVPLQEIRPLLVFKREHSEAVYEIYGHIWFRLYPEVTPISCS